MRTLASLAAPLAATTLALALAACAPASPDCADDERCDDGRGAVILLDQGAAWEPVRDLYYYTHQGSRLVPYRWFLALTRADGRRFASPANLERYGLTVEARASELNPDRLPIGFARDPRPGRYGEAWLGLTCSACHNSEVTYQGKRFRIDGGAGMFDLTRFETAMRDELAATRADDDRWRAFAIRLLGTKPTRPAVEALGAQVDEQIAWSTSHLGRTAPTTLPDGYGPGRTDAFTSLINEVVCAMLPIPANCRPGNAPTNFPHVWGMSDLEWVQSNATTHSVIGRNVGEVLGVFAHNAIDCPAGAPCAFESSADLENLTLIERWLKDLDAPSWRKLAADGHLPAIDDGLAAEGEALYRRDCASCHALPEASGRYATTTPNMCGRTFVPVVMAPPCFVVDGTDLLAGSPLQALAAQQCAAGDLGTDPLMIADLVKRTAQTGPLAAAAGGQPVVPAKTLLGIISDAVITEGFAELGWTTDAEQLAANDFRDPGKVATAAQVLRYKARPLDGVAFTAPFLHNGSVPTIDDLLKPPGERPTSFWVGRTELDVAKLGFVAGAPRAGEALFRYDATRLGNLNGGHAYGPAAPDYPAGARDADRAALLEFLKTLDVTPRSQAPLDACGG
jgi:hypothetical protein